MAGCLVFSWCVGRRPGSEFKVEPQSQLEQPTSCGIQTSCFTSASAVPSLKWVWWYLSFSQDNCADEVREGIPLKVLQVT